MKKEFLEILMKQDHFPCKLDKKDGEFLKKIFNGLGLHIAMMLNSMSAFQ